MNDKYMQEGPTTTTVFWVTGQMLKGAGMAFLFCLALLALWGVLRIASWALPEQSKQMPSPYGAVTVVRATDIA